MATIRAVGPSHLVDRSNDTDLTDDTDVGLGIAVESRIAKPQVISPNWSRPSTPASSMYVDNGDVGRVAADAAAEDPFELAHPINSNMPYVLRRRELDPAELKILRMASSDGVYATHIQEDLPVSRSSKRVVGLVPVYGSPNLDSLSEFPNKNSLTPSVVHTTPPLPVPSATTVGGQKSPSDLDVPSLYSGHSSLSDGGSPVVRIAQEPTVRVENLGDHGLSDSLSDEADTSQESNGPILEPLALHAPPLASRRPPPSVSHDELFLSRRAVSRSHSRAGVLRLASGTPSPHLAGFPTLPSMPSVPSVPAMQPGMAHFDKLSALEKQPPGPAAVAAVVSRINSVDEYGRPIASVRTARISFAACTLFPPALFLLAFGYMDTALGVVPVAYKRAALAVGSAFFAVAIACIVVGLTVH